MKKVLIIGCLGVPALVIVALTIAYFILPTKYDVESSITINAGVEKIYPLVNTLRRWPEWTVWTTEEYPTMVTTYSGPESGVGAKSSWTDEQGDGSMEITQSDPQSGIDYKLQFAEFPESQGRVNFRAVDGGTKVIMGLAGEMPGPWKFLLPFVRPAMIDEHRQNLEKLKAVVEAN